MCVVSLNTLIKKKCKNHNNLVKFEHSMDSGGKRRDFWISSASIIGTMSIDESQEGEIRCFSHSCHFVIIPNIFLKIN